MFDAALGLAPDWEKPAFCYAVYLDQLMVDAQRRQQALQQLLAQQAAAHKVLRSLTSGQGPAAGSAAALVAGGSPTAVADTRRLHWPSLL